jgi:hypothetical protein
LLHPDDTATANAVPASTGTVMYGSGYLNDNPSVNSQEYANNVSNPLLQFALKIRSRGRIVRTARIVGRVPSTVEHITSRVREVLGFLLE